MRHGYDSTTKKIMVARCLRSNYLTMQCGPVLRRNTRLSNRIGCNLHHVTLDSSVVNDRAASKTDLILCFDVGKLNLSLRNRLQS